MNRSQIVWVLIILVVSPFLVFGAGQFIPYYDGFIVTSGSMEPEIMTGSLLFTLDVSADRIEVGDTITYRSGDSHTTHQVIQRNATNGSFNFTTQGIANDSPDPGVVTEGELVGKKLFSIPLLGYFISWAGTTTGLIVLIVLPGALLIFLEVWKIVSEIETNSG